MAIVKIINARYDDTTDLKNLVDYATDICATHGLIGGLGLNPYNSDKMIDQMIAVKRAFGKETGYRQARHFLVSFDKAEQITPQEAYFIAYEISQFYGFKYQICFGVHQDSDDLHIHFIQNTVNYVNGKLFSNSVHELNILKNYVNQLVSRHTHSKQEQFAAFLND